MADRSEAAVFFYHKVVLFTPAGIAYFVAMTEKTLSHTEKIFPGLLMFYLEHGYLPSVTEINGRAAFEEQLGKWLQLPFTAAFTGQLKNTLRNEAAAKRLLKITPPRYQWLFLEKLHGSSSVHDSGKAILQLESVIAHYPAYLSKTSPFHETFRQVMMEALLKWIVYEKEEVFPLCSIAARAMRYAGYSSEISRRIFTEANLEDNKNFDANFESALNAPALQQQFFFSDSQTTSSPQLLRNESICIFNAGLVLAAHYLNDFFERTGLKRDKQLIYPGLAVTALQWMATGAEQFAEFELVLPKLLCGIDPHQCLPHVNEIPSFIKKKAHDLLEYLSIIKNISVEALRRLFLQRTGKLSYLNDHWFLQVEHDSCALLPEHFPLSAIKLPVMKEIIYVEW